MNSCPHARSTQTSGLQCRAPNYKANSTGDGHSSAKTKATIIKPVTSRLPVSPESPTLCSHGPPSSALSPPRVAVTLILFPSLESEVLGVQAPCSVYAAGAWRILCRPGRCVWSSPRAGGASRVILLLFLPPASHHLRGPKQAPLIYFGLCVCKCIH